MTEKVILLVEDNPDDEALMLRAFARSNLANRIEVARDGAEALAYLVGPSPRPLPTHVILDLKLPKVDGLEVLRRVRADERTRTLPVVILTSSREEQDLVESYRLGANSYVRKPVDFTSFASAVQTLGLYWLVVNEPPPLKDHK
jgi:two-component system response regulator